MKPIVKIKNWILHKHDWGEQLVGEVLDHPKLPVRPEDVAPERLRFDGSGRMVRTSKVVAKTPTHVETQNTIYELQNPVVDHPERDSWNDAIDFATTVTAAVEVGEAIFGGGSSSSDWSGGGGSDAGGGASSGW